MKACKESRATVPLIFNLGIKWREIFNFRPRPL